MLLVSCKPEIEKPTIVMKSVGEVTKTSAKVVGQVTADGGAEVTERGVCWNTEGTPEIIDYRTVDGKGVGIYTSNMTDLEPNTTYYVRVYATNEVGTAYGEEVSFKTTFENGREYVDLGLSVKWATCNIGANSPEEYGDYFSWGETTTKSIYTDVNCTTYGKIMNDIAGNAEYDAARANWGGDWRMPTIGELHELRDNCTWTWKTQDGNNGYKVTGPSGASIFLPAAGYRYGFSLDVDDAGSYGFYWSSTPGDYYDGAYRFGFDSSDLDMDYIDRYCGLSVRPVLE